MNKSDRPLLQLYRLMMFSRQLDKVIGTHDGHWHGLEGEEAVVAGVYYGLRESDVVAPHYRGSPVASYAKGADLRRLIAGMFGKQNGYNLGRHRSDVCGPTEYNVIGLYSGSLGPPIGYATGAALAAKLDKRDDIAVAVFGDGVSSRGDCHEAMNIAAVQKLPIIFVCQNNGYAISTDAQSGVAGSVADRGRSFGLPSLEVDGNDVFKVYDAMQDAIARARSGGGASVIEAKTYRVAGHFYSDAEDYRDQEQVNLWRQRDPIKRLVDYLLEQSITSIEQLKAIEEEISDEIVSAFELAVKDPPPSPSQVNIKNVYAGGIQ